MAPNPRYEAGWLWDLIFGKEYRRVWATPVTVPVLDLNVYAGGLNPLKTGGFGQTTSLHMRGQDGIRYVHRSLDKDPTRGLPPELKNTFVADIVQDQISSQHPYASLVVPDLLEPIGVLHVVPELYVMPDSPRLGEYREQFAGLVGGFEERPNEAPDGSPGFAGADKVKSSEGMYDDLEDDGNEHVDAIAFLEARLMDIFLGDRDRHFDQWRWARIDNRDGSRKWFPIPKDRDQAFKVNDGLMMWAIRIYQFQFVSFGEEYPNIEGASYNGRELDRRLLVGLGASVWDSIAVEIQSKLTDSVIVRAVRNLPAEVFEVSGEEMIQRLKSRRDLLPEMAKDYYLLLANVVDLHSSDDPDVARIHRLPNGKVEIEIRTQSGYPYFDRTFHPEETSEIRVLTHGGDDSLLVSGFGDGPITLRILPGGGDDVIVDTSLRGSGKKTLWYDHRGDNVVELGDNAELDTGEPYKKHPDELFTPPHPEDMEARKAQTYGDYWFPVGSIGYAPDFGLIVGGGAYQVSYGFRKQPYAYKWSVEGVVTTSTRFKLLTKLDLPDIGPRWESHLDAYWSRLELIRFNGFGNDVALEREAGSTFYDTRSTEITGSLFFKKRFSDNISIDFGPVFTWARDESREGTFVKLSSDTLLGARDDLFLPGVGVSVTFDSRDNPGASRRGVYLNLQGRGIPRVLGVDSLNGYGKALAQAAAFVSLDNAPLDPTLGLRVGGSLAGGDFPFYRASFLGGRETIRGYRENRYAGDAMAFGNAELRFKVAEFPLILPWEAGLFGFADGGRVWYDGDPDNANKLHTGYGGGLWFSVLNRAQSFATGIGVGEEETLFYFGAGFHF